MSGSKTRVRAEVRARAAQNGGPCDLGGAATACAAEGGTALALRVERLARWQSARTVALYVSMPGEAPTADMLARWAGVKRLSLPVITGDGAMVFREYRRHADLSAGAFGIASPSAGAIVPSEEIDLMLVPGVAFDAAGGRLGRGGGFYDRYLSAPAAARIYKVGLCPPRALLPRVPTEPHDVAMDAVITAE